MSGKVIQTTIDMNKGEVTWSDITLGDTVDKGKKQLHKIQYEKCMEGEWYFTILISNEGTKAGILDNNNAWRENVRECLNC